MTASSVSVVVPTYNREEALQRCLEAWDRQRRVDADLELVVVDDGSTDGTIALLEAYRPRNYRLSKARQSNRGPASARNRALEHCRGELVLFTGDDIVPHSDLLAEHLAGHRANPQRGTAILGQTGWPTGYPTTTTMRHIDGVGSQQFSYRYMKDGEEYDFRHFYTSNISVRRELLDLEPSGFSTDFRRAAFEDAELSYRLSFHGLRILYRAAAVADHLHHYDARRFFGRQLACGEMAAVLYGKHPELRKWLSLSEIEWMALDVQATGQADDSGLDCLADGEEHLIRLASFFDWAEQTPVHGLLLAVFRYAYLKGLVSAVLGDGDRRVLLGFMRQLVLPAVDQFRAQMHHLRAPLPVADVEALERCR